MRWTYVMGVCADEFCGVVEEELKFKLVSR
jgi:hypothetical protein